MRKKIVMTFVLLSLVLGSLGNSVKAQEDPLRRFYREGGAAAAEAQWQLWSSFSPRQKYLSKLVASISDQVWSQYQQPIPMTPEMLTIIVEGIGAQPGEAEFVWSRMQAHHDAAIGMREVDAGIDRMQRFSDCLQRQGTGCIP